MTKSSRSIELACCEVMSVGRTLIERTRRNYAGFFPDTGTAVTATQLGCSKLYSEAVYTGLSNGARGILFPNYGHQGLPVEDGKDTERGYAALPEKRVQGYFIEGMQDAMADAFTEAGKIMEKRLSLGAKFVLVRLTKVPPVERGKISLGMECRDDKAAFGMQHTMPFLQRRSGRRDVRQRKIAHQSI